MNRSRLVFTISTAASLALSFAFASCGAPAGWHADPQLFHKAKESHKRIIAFDSHLDLPFDYAGAAEDGKTQFDLPKVIRGQLKGAALAVFVPQGPRTPEGYKKAREDAEKKLALIRA